MKQLGILITAVVLTCAVRCAAPPLTYGRASPCVDALPSLAVYCTFTVKNRWPEVVCHAAASGLREAAHAELAGSMRPGLKLDTHQGGPPKRGKMTDLRLSEPLSSVITLTESLAPPTGEPGANETLAGLYR